MTRTIFGRIPGMLIAAVAFAAALMLPASAHAGGGGGGGGCHDPATSGAGNEADIERFCYSPTTLYVEPGTEVTWTNHDRAPHTVTGTQGSWGNHELLRQGDSITFAFDEPGVFPYFCVLHPTMQGVVVVGDGSSPDTVPAMQTSSAARPPAGGVPGALALVLMLGGVLVGAAGARALPSRHSDGTA